MISAVRRIHPAWIAAAVTFLALMGAAGFRSAPSVLMVPLQDYFGWSRATISFAIGVNVLLYGLTAPFAAALMDRFGIRRVVMVAMTAVTVGAVGTIWMTAPWQLVLLWGFVVGTGTGSMALVFAATVVNRWFVQRRGLVVGILTAAAATGQLIFLPGVSSIAVHHGWKSASIVVGAASFVMVPLVFFFLKERPSDVGVLPFGADSTTWQAPVPSQISPAKLAINTLREVSRCRDFWLLTGSFLVCGLSTTGLLGTHFIPAAHDHGMPETTAAGLLALVGVFDVVGTIASGWFTDHIGATKLLAVYYGFRGLSLIFLPSILYSSIKPSTMVFVIFYGLDWVATVPPTVWLCREIFGADRGAIVYGWVFAAHQIGGSIAAIGAGILRDHLGNYRLAFYLAGVLCLMTALLVTQIGRTPAAVKIKAAI